MFDKYKISKIDEFEMDEIGKKIQEALDLDEFHELEPEIEMPSREQFDEWIRLGEERYRKRRRRKMIIWLN